jgi:MoCo/4Fe-4S cofactor protein with predicted Tat translocation signal
MSANDSKTYWRSLAERDGDAAAADEFRAVPEGGGLELSRRGFLRAAGFAFAGAAVSGGARTPVPKAIPYLVQPEAITPGRAYYYASTCGGCSAGCGLLVKDRDGRPIKLEGSPDHPVSHGGLCAVGQASISKAVQPMLAAERPPDGALALVLYPEGAMLDGSHAYNPWLQELPDPVSKVTWDNYACLSPATAERLGLSDGDVVRVQAGEGRALELPVFRQPGQHDDVLAMALGYGARVRERFAQVGPQWLEGRGTLGENGLVGVNAAPLLAWKDGRLCYTGTAVRLTRTAKRHALAPTQTDHRLTVPEHLAPAGAGPRPIIQETTLQQLGTDRLAGIDYPLWSPHQSQSPPAADPIGACHDAAFAPPGRDAPPVAAPERNEMTIAPVVRKLETRP